MQIDIRNALAAFGLVAIGALGAQALGGGAPVPASAQSKPDHGSSLQIINSKSNETLIFVYDEESKRLVMCTSSGPTDLRLGAVRNLTWDERLPYEFPRDNPPHPTVAEVKKAVEDKEALDAKKKADGKTGG